MKRIGIVIKSDHPQRDVILEKLVHWLRQQKKEVRLLSPSPKPLPTSIEMIIVLGGDGTLLSVARQVQGRDLLILGVNLGSLGFLTEVTFEELYPTLERIFQNQFMEDPRRMLTCHIRRGRTRLRQPSVLNEIAVNSGTRVKLIRMEVSIDGLFVTSLRADGLIVATATGSTGYSLSVGGPILHPSLDAMILTPISPHTLTQRPIVVPSNARIEITLKTVEPGPVIAFDSQAFFPLQPNDIVQIQTSEKWLKLIRSPDRNYYQVLREKLRWGDPAAPAEGGALRSPIHDVQ
jgi:NAD+ kinase